jgi:hypothetical protein
MDVSLAGHPADDLDSSWLEGIDSAAATAARTSARLIVARGWARIVITPATHFGEPAPGVTAFTGALHQRDSWHRVRGVLRDKVRRSIGAPGVWIRMDAVDGLFALTDWARSEMTDRVTVMADLITATLADADHVQGVILSSGAGVDLDSPSQPLLHQRADTDSGAIRRRLIAPGLLRETAIVTLRPEAEPIAALFVQVYDAEARWLFDDLAQRGWSLTRMRTDTTGWGRRETITDPGRRRTAPSPQPAPGSRFGAVKLSQSDPAARMPQRATQLVQVFHGRRGRSSVASVSGTLTPACLVYPVGSGCRQEAGQG